ncbi:pre-mRNA processing RNA-helicase [Irineochytrium annulatum]|nr:pre-mRNA processing RNA-helicase [Irineochytrium annulatum]
MRSPSPSSRKRKEHKHKLSRHRHDSREKDRDDDRRRDRDRDHRDHREHRDRDRDDDRRRERLDRDRDRDRDRESRHDEALRRRSRSRDKDRERNRKKSRHDDGEKVAREQTGSSVEGSERLDPDLKTNGPVSSPAPEVMVISDPPSKSISAPAAVATEEAASLPVVTGPPQPNQVGIRPPSSSADPAQESIKNVMDSLSVEEKTRQRRERVEKWRKEKLAKEKEEKMALNGVSGIDVDVVTPASANDEQEKPTDNDAMQVDEETANVSNGIKRKGWSLEDDDEDDVDASPRDVEQLQVVPSVVPLPSLKPLTSRNEDDFTGFIAPKVKTIAFAATNSAGSGVKGRALIAMKSSKPNLFKSKLGLSAVKVTKRPVVAASFEMDTDDVSASDKAPARRRFKRPSLMENAPSPMVEDGGTDAEDALDAFMVDVDSEVKKLHEEDQKAMSNGISGRMEAEEVVGEARVAGDEDEAGSDDDEDILGAAAKKLASKRKDLATVDHSTVQYEYFRKDFYIEPPEIAVMTEAEVDIIRADLGGVKIRGVNCPKPIQKWAQMGLTPGAFEVIKKVLKYEKPTSIQAQSIPAVMSGRDVIGIAKTGSGKDQRPLELGEGPIGLIMTPTRELAVQIFKECKPFTKALNLRAVCCYGGSPIKDQIAELKRGAEIIICTPGRMIDLLCANSGRVTNLKRVTYLVLDEADRMFDMGFEPQVMKMVNNIRPSRQTILFSATFPRKMEALARKILKQPLEITVGGRSVVCPDVHQIVEVRDEDSKFLRLLEILGLTMANDADSKVLVFVDRQDGADNLLRDLLKRGYPCQTLHGGKDQSDRDSTIADFKGGDINIVIATSVAARGLDVKQLKVVINYDCPNHMEDYVHRCGRTGRAGNKGTAYTFITPDQDKYSVVIVQALKMSKAEVPQSLQDLADGFILKVKDGKANYTSSGFGGKGLDKLEKERDTVKSIQKRMHGSEYAEEAEGVSDDSGDEGPDGLPFVATAVKGPSADKAREEAVLQAASNIAKQLNEAAAAAPKENLQKFQDAINEVNAKVGIEGFKKAKDIIDQLNSRYRGEAKKSGGDSAFAYEIEINDYPQKARWKVTNKEQIVQITEMSGAAITTRGTYVLPGKQPGPNERKLFLHKLQFIEGESQLSIDIAKKEIKRILKEETNMALESGSMGGSARYLVTNG